MTSGYFIAAALRSDGPALPEPLLSRLRDLRLEPRKAPPRVRLFAADSVAIRQLAETGGLVVGAVFDRAGHEAPLRLAAEAIDDACGFVDRFWGSYISVKLRADAVEFTRDPSGGLACYLGKSEGWIYATSLPHVLIESGLADGAIDWVAVAAHVLRSADRPETTALTGVTELLPGTALTINRNGAHHRRAIWDPWHAAAPQSCPNPDEQLCDILDMTLASWGRSAVRPLVEVSGGLDSAIVAAGIARASPSAALITFAAAEGDPDETLYAAALADHLGLTLHIAQPQIDAVDLTQSRASDLPRPTARAFVQAADDCSLAYAQSIGADMFVSGGGGDDVFGFQRNALAAIDHWRRHGLRAGLRTAHHIAIMNHATIWDVFASLVRRMMRPTVAARASDARFLHADVTGAGVTGAVETAAVDRLPGKAAHVANILSIHNYLEGHARSGWAPIVSPLLSQPVIEACLAIPSWQWCDKGINRAAARNAYADRLPQLLRERRSKGSFDGFCAQLLDANRQLIGDMLMNGDLARQRLLDRDAIANALAQRFPSPGSVTRLLELVDVEAWVQSWRSRRG